MKLVVCERFLNVQTSKQRGKKLMAVGGVPWRQRPSHSTTGTVVNPALPASMTPATKA